MGSLFARSSSCPARSSTSWSDVKGLTRTFVCTLFLVALAGCGFKPLYGDSGTANALTNLDVAVEAGDGQVGRLVQYALLDSLSSASSPSNPEYRVELTTNFFEQDLAIQRDAEVTRTSVVATVYFKLVDVRTGKQVMKSVSRSRTSYNRVASEFANIVAAQDAQKRVARAIADDIRIQVAVQLDRLASRNPS